MGLSQSNHRLLGGTKSSLSTTFTPCLIGGARRPLTAEQREEKKRRLRERMRKRRANMTAEQRKQRNMKQRERWAKMTAEQRKEFNRMRRERRARMRDQAEVEDQPSIFELDDFIITEYGSRI